MYKITENSRTMKHNNTNPLPTITEISKTISQIKKTVNKSTPKTIIII